ncbi:MAG: ATP-binding cassette domain-containing protein [Nitrospinota bacterium]
MIQIRNLRKQIASKLLFKDINFHLHPKEKVGLVGENGSGKSTLFRTILKREVPDSGEILMRKGITVAMLEQDLEPRDESILTRVLSGKEEYWRVRSEMVRLEEDEAFHTESPELWSKEYGNLQHQFESIGGYRQEPRGKTILQGLGFSKEDFDKNLGEFSGGMRIRVELARFLLQTPDILLLDEPSNHLDLFSVVWLESFLKNYPGAIILISHDRLFLNGIVDRIVELDRGTLTSYSGNYDFFEKEKAEQAARLKASAANQKKRVSEVEKFIERFRSKNTKATQVQSKIKMLAKMERVETVSQTKQVAFRFPQPPRTGRVVADMLGISKSYGEKNIYSNFSACVEKGFKIALVGVNGAGKSTLLKIVAGVLPFEKGEIKYGSNVSKAYYAQHHGETLEAGQTVLESMEEASPLLDQMKRRTILGGFLFSGEDVNKRVGILSGGERARLALARMLSAPSSLLLLDEPTNHLDIRSCDVLAAALKDFEGTLLTISHDRFFLDGVINRVWEVEAGTLREYIGNYSDYEQAKSLEAEQNGFGVEKQGSTGEATEKGKERKRKEAEERNRRYKKLKPLKAELERVEKRLESLFEEKSAVGKKISDPDLYLKERKTELMDVLAHQKKIVEEEKALMAQWDRLVTVVEQT